MTAAIFENAVSIERVDSRALVSASFHVSGLSICSGLWKWTSLENNETLCNDIVLMQKQSKKISLEERRRDLPEDLETPYVKAFGFKTKKQYRGSRDVVSIHTALGICHVYPLENRGAKMGCVPITDARFRNASDKFAVFKVSTENVDQIGEAVVSAFNLIDRIKQA